MRQWPCSTHATPRNWPANPPLLAGRAIDAGKPIAAILLPGVLGQGVGAAKPLKRGPASSARTRRDSARQFRDTGFRGDSGWTDASVAVFPSRSRRRTLPFVYAGLLIALAAFGLGRAREIVPGIIARIEQVQDYYRLVSSTQAAFAKAMQANLSVPGAIPSLPHRLTLYPILAQRLSEEGDVRLRVLVLSSGEVGDVQVVRSSGYAQLDAAALIGVGYWYYIPAMKDHEPVNCWIEVLVRFRMQNQPAA
jgi:TonB family protein